jgi:hypothetical protein
VPRRRASRPAEPVEPFTGSVVDSHIAEALGPLLAELHASSDPHQRGPDFELLLQKLFRLNGFEVERDPAIARPRQTDLLARRGERLLLLEAKWQRDPIDIDDLDSMESRLRRAPRSTVGCYFSMSTYTQEALDRAASLRKVELGGHELILFFPSEVAALLRGGITLAHAIDSKLRVLREEGRTPFLKDLAPPRFRPLDIPFPSPTIARRPNDEEVPTDGRAYNFAFGRLPGGFESYRSNVEGFELYGSVEADTVEELLGFLHLMHSHLGFRGQSSYTITELRNEKVWYGSRPEKLVLALADIAERYKRAGIETAHHSEEFSFYDTTDIGALFVFGRHNVSTGRLDGVSFELRLPGIPLDPEPLRLLADALNMPFDYLTPIDSEKSNTFEFSGAPLFMEPVEYLMDPSHPDFCNAAVVRNPLFDVSNDVVSTDVPEPLRSLSCLVGRVGDHLADTERVHRFFVRKLRVTMFREAYLVDLFLGHDETLRYDVPKSEPTIAISPPNTSRPTSRTPPVNAKTKRRSKPQQKKRR